MTLNLVNDKLLELIRLYVVEQEAGQSFENISQRFMDQGYSELQIRYAVSELFDYERIDMYNGIIFEGRYGTKALSGD